MRVFVSSTVYDLLDCRAEVAAHLREMGFDPVLSDLEEYRFDTGEYKSALETCFSNLRASNICIVILNQRYGQRHQATGNISATHAELRCALAELRDARRRDFRLHFFVRDRLLGEYHVWKRSRKGDHSMLAWVSESEMGLFDCLDEYLSFFAEGQPGFCDPFRNSVELKKLISSRMGAESGRILAKRFLETGQGPVFSVFVTSPNQGMQGPTRVRVEFENVGQQPALNFSFRTFPAAIEPGQLWSASCFKPGKEMKREVDLQRDVFQHCQDGCPLRVEFDYETITGVPMKDTYQAEVRSGTPMRMSALKLISRGYRESGHALLCTAEEQN